MACASGLNQNGSVDISTLPQELMSRVDVVTGGASSVYGSDAITGVVNFILDKNFSGVKYEANAGISEYGDGFKYKVNVAAGTDLFGGRGHIEGAVEYHMPTACCSLPGPSSRRDWRSYNTGTTAANPVTNILHGRPDGLDVQRQHHLHQLLGQRLRVRPARRAHARQFGYYPRGPER